MVIAISTGNEQNINETLEDSTGVSTFSDSSSKYRYS